MSSNNKATTHCLPKELLLKSQLSAVDLRLVRTFLKFAWKFLFLPNAHIAISFIINEITHSEYTTTACVGRDPFHLTPESPLTNTRVDRSPDTTPEPEPSVQKKGNRSRGTPGFSPHLTAASEWNGISKLKWDLCIVNMNKWKKKLFWLTASV